MILFFTTIVSVCKYTHTYIQVHTSFCYRDCVLLRRNVFFITHIHYSFHILYMHNFSYFHLDSFFRLSPIKAE